MLLYMGTSSWILNFLVPSSFHFFFQCSLPIESLSCDTDLWSAQSLTNPSPFWFAPSWVIGWCSLQLFILGDLGTPNTQVFSEASIDKRLDLAVGHFPWDLLHVHLNVFQSHSLLDLPGPPQLEQLEEAYLGLVNSVKHIRVCARVWAQ